MSRVTFRFRPLLLLAALALAQALAAPLAGCKKESAEGGAGAEQGPPPPSETEVERARAACKDYQQKVCQAAEGKPALAEECKLAQPRLDALEMQVRALRSSGEMTDNDRRVVQAAVRRLAAECIQDAARL